MNPRSPSILAALGASSSLACAQAQSNPPVTVTYHLSWTEVSATAPYAPVATPNGLLEPGEGARFAFNASYTPGHGTPLTYPTSLLAGSSGAGTLGGFWSGSLDLTGNAGPGVWIVNQNTTPSGNPNRLGLIPPFTAGFPTASGTPNSDGSAIQNINPFIFGDSSFLNSVTPTTTMWRGLWIPTNYQFRTSTFSLGPGSLGLPTQVYAWDQSISFPVVINANAAFTSVVLPLIPSPPTFALLAAALLPASLRPRRSDCTITGNLRHRPEGST
jgi:hypothetical protein